MNVTVTTRERLDFWACFFLKSASHILLKSQNLSSKSTNGSNTSIQEGHEFYCKAHGAFLLGEEEDKSGSVAVTILITVIVVIALFGVISNIGNIIILRRSFSGRRHFRESLVLLSVIDLMLSVAAIGITSLTVSIMENANRGQTTFIFFMGFKNMFYVTRSMSVYLTILITVERYLVVTFPSKCTFWLQDETPWKSRMSLLIILVFSFLLNLPWILKSSLAENEYHQGYLQSTVDVDGYDDGNKNGTLSEILSNELLDFPYLIKRNKVAEKLLRGAQLTLLVFDFLMPFPILLVFNALLYRSIHIWTTKRNFVSGRQKRDINAAKMFSVVTLVSLICHMISFSVLVTSRFQNVIYIELFLLQRLSVVVVASSSFIIYYWFGPGFKWEFWNWLKCVCSFNERFTGWIDKHLEKPTREVTTISRQHTINSSHQED